MCMINDALTDFLFEKEIQGVTKKTLICYKEFISPFVAYTGDIDVFKLCSTNYKDYIQNLFKRQISKATVATYVRHLKIFLVWLQSEYGININAEKIKVPKSPKKNPYIYNDDEIRLIFETAKLSGDWLSCRNCAMIALMLDSGLRQNEVCTLKTKDLDMKNHILKVFGKGEKERFVPVGNLSVKLLQQYFAFCPYSGEYVFYTKYGKPMTQNAVKLFISKLSSQLPFEFSSHKLRHNFATNFLVDSYNDKGTMDIYALLTILGHEDVHTTERYLHIANQMIYSKSHISHIDKIENLF